ncbi:putative disease resistance protein At5g05400 [Gossypium raimondii]|uniref:putative disease resistance protein At5g05400 n=1 Tax=Gossypium raimondii TaxID=29730 RepID=UPI00227C3296|nr:putative disease resistance protein At5g05400 [Gossypium raimondii]
MERSFVEFSSHARHAKVAMQGEVAASSRAMKCRNWSLKLPNYLLCFDSRLEACYTSKIENILLLSLCTNIVEDFTNQRKALKLRKQRVKTRVDEAKRKIEVIYEDVEDWLRSAEKELEETQNLEDEIDSIKCFKWCPKWGWRYCLSKKLAEKTPIISKLLEASNFPQVGYRGSLQGIEFITSTDFMDSESSKSALNQIMEAINAKGVKMIGLQGMPGVGKTTLAQEVGKQAREQKLFDKVVMFTMSQNPNINKIQDKVADIFGLNFETSSREGKAEVLFRSMQGVNKILVIVDDLWEELKLERIGIPFGDEHKGCKILLTTRDQQVCTKMNCTKEIQLGILSEDEAWVLFRGKAGLDDDSSTLNDVAKEVAAQCKGLPLAIVVVAKALKDKRNEIVMALKKLQKSGLILGTDDAERIRMHDVVRDFAHWLTSTGENRFMVKDELKEWPDMDGCYSAIALWNCSINIKKLPDKVEFSKLKTLILEGDWDCDWNWDLRQKRKRKRGDLLVVSSIFFEEMKALQVLYLESVSFLPIGFHSLPNLRTVLCGLRAGKLLIITEKYEKP